MMLLRVKITRRFRENVAIGREITISCKLTHVLSFSSSVSPFYIISTFNTVPDSNVIFASQWFSVHIIDSSYGLWWVLRSQDDVKQLQFYR